MTHVSNTHRFDKTRRCAWEFTPVNEAERRYKMLLMRCELAQIELALFERKYRPDQPRVPAGNPDGGQWTDEDGGFSSRNDDARAAQLRERITEPDREATEAFSADFKLAAGFASDWVEAPRSTFGEAPDGTAIEAVSDPAPWRPRINLLEHEDVEKGHTIKYHVEKSEYYLRQRAYAEQLEYISESGRRAHWPRDGYSASSFSSLEAANKLVSAALATDPLKLFRIATGELPDGTFKIWFGSKTGIEAYVATPYSTPVIRDTNGVVVYVMHSKKMPFGFRIHTAYPKRR